MHPYADTFIKKNQTYLSEPIFPLQCILNSRSGEISNFVKTNDIERYNQYEYSYTSSNSEFSKTYWRSFYKDISTDIKILKNTKILEVGSNDGFLLSLFKKKTKKILGVDASSKMSKIANNKNIKTINLIMNINNGKKILNKNGKFDLIIANNVLNHANNVNEFINGIKYLMHKNSVFIFEVPYWLDLVKQKKFDQIYHEHVNYFTAKFSKNILKKNKLTLIKIKKTKYHGGSIRVYCKLEKKNATKIRNSNLNKMINDENKYKIFDKNMYKKFMYEINLRKFKILKSIFNFKLKGYTIVGVGAAAKANTFINFLGLNNLIVDFVTDISKFKIGKLTPLSRIPIFHDNKIKNKKKICIIIFAWNLSHILKNKILKINKNAVFVEF